MTDKFKIYDLMTIFRLIELLMFLNKKQGFRNKMIKNAII